MMKKFLSLAAIATVGAIFSCQTDEGITNSEVSAEALAKISALGFSTDNVQLVDDGYLVEGDIFLNDNNLNSGPSGTTLRVAEVEQYHTYDLVNSPRTITVSASSDAPASVSSALDAAIARYNSENLELSFTRVASGGDIHVAIIKGGNYIASAGFPNNGRPHGTVKFNRQYAGYSAGFLTTVLAHEIGHCIGFRHTDYMNRSYSCGGSGGNEGSGTVGAVHIPGTPTGPDSGSWMLACLSATTNRPFNNNDKTALDYLY
jgi:hypothetical protein